MHTSEYVLNDLSIGTNELFTANPSFKMHHKLKPQQLNTTMRHSLMKDNLRESRASIPVKEFGIKTRAFLTDIVENEREFIAEFSRLTRAKKNPALEEEVQLVKANAVELASSIKTRFFKSIHPLQVDASLEK